MQQPQVCWSLLHMLETPAADTHPPPLLSPPWLLALQDGTLFDELNRLAAINRRLSTLHILDIGQQVGPGGGYCRPAMMDSAEVHLLAWPSHLAKSQCIAPDHVCFSVPPSMLRFESHHRR
jgi:hypothetical protein